MENETNQNKNNPYLIPGAIIVAGALIAASVYVSLSNSSGGGPEGFGNGNSASAENVRPLNDDDHVFGNPDAQVSIIEFSDFECPFCQVIHSTLKQIVSESNGEVNWVYRHFPLTSLHAGALPGSVVSECVARFAGNDAFWSFADTLFANQDKFSPAFFEQTARSLGLTEQQYTACTESNATVALVQEDFEEAVTAGGQGTPFVVVMNKDGETFPFSGALPYEQVKAIVESAQ
ncbi:hypothetical protein COU17_02995 [Candidatus Kaiserbacteria bacterium CG10_big_fil_rev_8_21_14_0_10_49_17]|uniref:Thioredoxin domain-containing protein n=1 Tax=Candidatus Kaiserbacteria bacterium CG10_big_fil_rev_8_21_14_0_10_49_17 TaxID=1974609 RepID=A0A2M6WDN9_9BACT|nr:MAG: hypothetical protein COU17_02995 [Candidatus Kaiserbacteria bacterium CG10_big_fil_rev_8_21_14_0_10_49_17]